MKIIVIIAGIVFLIFSYQYYDQKREENLMRDSVEWLKEDGQPLTADSIQKEMDNRRQENSQDLDPQN